MQRFLNCLPVVYKEKIEFDNPKNMDKVVRKARLCYQQSKGKAEHGKSWLNKGEIKGKKQKPAYLRNFCRDHQRKSFNKPKESQTSESQIGSKQLDEGNKKEGTIRMREPLKCWDCGEPHLLRDCPHQNIQMITRDREATTVNDIARNIPTISAAL